ncbi:hypothetical protein [Streptomyces iconiensis]|uniref:Uncharacterized protein n=1 Tax=Streptomyces iconiensis TaxID=1384038 RepID=A0ABT6ZWF7_9ACTN|nr:hypothetical protein [Streptomyces iconiensis]MDJ1133402.1 hypothetical protein [Streptomyces iconiensis]
MPQGTGADGEPQGPDVSTGPKEPAAPEEPEAGDGEAAVPEPAPPGRWRRMVRGKPAVAVVGVLVGALLGTGVMVWRSGELSSTAKDMCWGSLSPDVVSGLVSDGEIRDQELPLRALSGSAHNGSPQCRIQRFKNDNLEWEVTANVRKLSTTDGWDARQWSREFLSSRMAPLRGEITGMVSSSRAWAVLPASCQGMPREGDPPTVVTLSSGPAEPRGEERAEARRYRDALARALVHLANGVLDKYGCEGRYPEPDKMPASSLPEVKDEAGPEELCGVKGVRATRRGFGADRHALSTRVTPGAEAEESGAQANGPGAKAGAPASAGVRSCDVGRKDDELGELRLMTVEDQGLAWVFSEMLRHPAVRLKGTGSGGFSGDLTVYTATCQTGQVAFVAQEEGFGDESAALAVLPSYVKSEAKRIGCGEVDVKVPRLPS